MKSLQNIYTLLYIKERKKVRKKGLLKSSELFIKSSELLAKGSELFKRSPEPYF